MKASAVWEIDLNKNTKQWKLYAKGGSYSPYYADVYLLINWLDNARELEADLLKKYPYLGSSAEFVLHMKNPYFRPGLTWPRRTTQFGLRILPKECVFADKGPAAFVDNDNPESLLSLLAILLSSSADQLISLSLNAADKTARSFEVGVIQRTVIPERKNKRLPKLALDAWSQKRRPDSANANSHAFVAPALAPSRVHSTLG